MTYGIIFVNVHLHMCLRTVADSAGIEEDLLNMP